MSNYITEADRLKEIASKHGAEPYSIPVEICYAAVDSLEKQAKLGYHGYSFDKLVKDVFNALYSQGDGIIANPDDVEFAIEDVLLTHINKEPYSFSIIRAADTNQRIVTW